MIPTLIKLLAMRIIANKCFGLSKSFIATAEDFPLSFSNSSISPGLKEKKATSDPDIMADMNKRIKRIANPTRTGTMLASP